MKLDITPEEAAELSRLVESWLSDTRVELRRTRTSDFQQQLRDEEKVLRSLQEKLKHLTEGISVG